MAKAFPLPSRPMRHSSRLFNSFGVALMIETALLAGAAYLMWRSAPPPAPTEAPMHLSLVTLPPKPKPPAPKPVVPKPPPVPVPHPAVTPPPRPAPPRPRPVVQPIVTPVPSAEAPVVVAPPPPPPPPPSPPVDVSAAEDAMATLEDQVRAAVQAALIYPPAARMLGEGGKAEVGFTYIDGVVSDAAITQSSGYPQLDRGALQTVAITQYPPPPTLLAHRKMHMTVWVVFHPQQVMDPNAE